ncbi:GDP-mannose pyrophosphatase NudK [Olleya aquimaris]|uniref:GDP-mannose pyrophosphatase NudK n=1 Tax=uncultured Olleya sp. TaxID=757243 RepID=UPI0004917F2B|nr:GDP-mannose pyrophosphatase NudK [uncultured Olleya sp.]AXO79406.1 GDP-mannose pyrophosphatase NudK [Olleya aquimaris]
MNNNRIKNLKTNLLSDHWYTLNKLTYDYLQSNGQWTEVVRECYDKGDGAVILLFNKTKKTVVLTKQFRIPTFVNGNEDGFLIEACAGLLDNDLPEDCIKKEVKEETGYKIEHVEKVMEAYSAPGAVTEILHYFIAEYTDDMKINEGGGAVNETEDIEVLEMSFESAVNMINTGEIKDIKTICLLQYAQINNIFINS